MQGWESRAMEIYNYVSQVKTICSIYYDFDEINVKDI